MPFSTDSINSGVPFCSTLSAVSTPRGLMPNWRATWSRDLPWGKFAPGFAALPACIRFLASSSKILFPSLAASIASWPTVRLRRFTFSESTKFTRRALAYPLLDCELLAQFLGNPLPSAAVQHLAFVDPNGSRLPQLTYVLLCLRILRHSSQESTSPIRGWVSRDPQAGP